MSNIGFMRNTVNHIERLFYFYMKNKKNIRQNWKKKVIVLSFFKWSVFIDMVKWKTKKNISSL